MRRYVAANWLANGILADHTEFVACGKRHTQVLMHSLSDQNLDRECVTGNPEIIHSGV